MRKITNEEYNVLFDVLLKEYHSFIKDGVISGRDKNDLRFGQKIINTFWLGFMIDIDDPKLYNEENIINAFVMIGQKLNELRIDYTPDI